MSKAATPLLDIMDILQPRRNKSIPIGHWDLGEASGVDDIAFLDVLSLDIHFPFCYLRMHDAIENSLRRLCLHEVLGAGVEVVGQGVAVNFRLVVSGCRVLLLFFVKAELPKSNSE